MNQIKKISLFFLTLLVLMPLGLSFNVLAEEKTAKNEKAGVEGEDGLMQRIDFGNSYIMGQTIQSGAVYLLQRKKSEIKSMLKPRVNYREEILEGFNISNGETVSNETYQR